MVLKFECCKSKIYNLKRALKYRSYFDFASLRPIGRQFERNEEARSRLFGKNK